ncbi:MAG: phosphoribosylaminoimidazolesuccinocarboxamide synthase [Oscillospiraceae bacterium]|nr:phosphoribosylaminoimidazolesuccinocarboxamide synthase [Oscillospiraceae bacterium]
MTRVYEGKTKTIYKKDDGNYILKFKDDATGTDGKFDPGANTVGLSIEGMGKSGLMITEHYFKKIEAAGIPTHFVKADIDKAELTVRPAAIFGQGIEVICRFKATGSFMRRYGAYAKEGQDLDAFVEVTLKDDGRGDPPITRDALDMLGIVKNDRYETLKALTQKISRLIKADLEAKSAELYDIKLEFGTIGGEVALIDEISAGNMRVYKDGKIVEPLDLAKLILGYA